MSLTVTFTDAEADVLREVAESEKSTVEDVVRRAVYAHLDRGSRVREREDPGSLLTEIEAARDDEGLIAVVDGVVARDREILDRLAE